jgi:undecaprenyl-diphosphatase
MADERATTRWTAATAAAILVVSWLLALSGDVSGFEESVFRAFNDLPDWLQAPTWPVMQLGALALVPAVAGLVFLVWRRWQPPAAILGAGAAAWLLAKLVKEAVGRGRPEALLGEVNLRPAWEGLGYVSGHTAVAFAMATVVSPLLGPVGRSLVWAAAVATGLLRMYTAAHLPLDIVGGAALGVLVGSAALRLVERANRTSERGSS